MIFRLSCSAVFVWHGSAFEKLWKCRCELSRRELDIVLFVVLTRVFGPSQRLPGRMVACAGGDNTNRLESVGCSHFCILGCLRVFGVASVAIALLFSFFLSSACDSFIQAST